MQEKERQRERVARAIYEEVVLANQSYKNLMEPRVYTAWDSQSPVLKKYYYKYAEAAINAMKPFKPSVVNKTDSKTPYHMG